MKKISTFFTCFFCLLFLITANADDTAFGGSGASPMPIKTTGVKMVNEHIVMKGIDLYNEHLEGAWQVTCLFNFQNLLDKKLDLRMGFPFPVRDEMGAIAAPHGYKVKVGDPLVHNFRVWVDGKLVTAKRYKITPNKKLNMYYKDAYLWNMSFAPKQILKIHHQYLIGVTFNTMGQNIASYVLRTGGLWQDGTIGHVVIEVIPNVPTRMCSEIKSKDMQYAPKPLPGVKIVGTKANRRYIWNITNLKPTQDFDLCLQTGKDFIRYNIVYPLISNNINPKKLTKAQRRILINAIYAQYGRTFRNAKLQQYFDKRWWYIKNPHFSNKLLTKSDRQAIAKLLR